MCCKDNIKTQDTVKCIIIIVEKVLFKIYMISTIYFLTFDTLHIFPFIFMTFE